MKGIPAAFKAIAPDWFEAFSDAKTIQDIPGADGNIHRRHDNGMQMDLSSAGNCAVGEAHKLSDAYWNNDECQECRSFSAAFLAIVEGTRDGRGSRKRQMITNIEAFTDHWKEKHDPLIDTIPETEPSEIEVQQPKAN